MALEIITGGNSNADVMISRGELIPTCQYIYPIQIMSYNIDLILENIALEIITGGVSIVNVDVRISSGKIWPKCLCTGHFDVL